MLGDKCGPKDFVWQLSYTLRVAFVNGSSRPVVLGSRTNTFPGTHGYPRTGLIQTLKPHVRRDILSSWCWLAVAVLLSQRRRTQCRQLVGATLPILNTIIYLLYSTAQRRCDSLPGSTLTGFARSTHPATLHWKYNLDRSRAF